MKSHVFLFLILSFPAFSQIGSKLNSNASLHGTWYNNDLGYQMTLVFHENGIGEIDGEEFRYKTENDKLLMTVESGVTTYNFSVQGEILVLSGGDIVSPVKFVKSPAIPVDSVAEPSNTDDSIIGSWSANGETIEFQKGGQCLYLGQTFTYSLSPGKVTLGTSQGDVAFDYNVNGDQLTFSVNGNAVVYSRSSAQHQQPAGAAGSKIDMTLVGKWCYTDVSNVYGSSSSSTNACITLNADGTYEYYGETSRSVNTPDLSGGTSSQDADRGTWYVDGDRIYYNSPTHGTGSYKLEKRNHPKNVNDPMIILDGAAYVSFYNKPAWR